MSTTPTLNRALDVIDVSNGQSLESYLRLPDSSGSVARLSLINGTQWATLGGGVKDFGLVLGKPPSTSSDTTLKEALNSFNTSVSLTYKQFIQSAPYELIYTQLEKSSFLMTRLSTTCAIFKFGRLLCLLKTVFVKQDKHISYL